MSHYSEFTWNDLQIEEQLFADYTSKYLDLKDKLSNSTSIEKTSILNDIDFELELIRRDKPDEIWILLKTLIKQEAENIKEHFIENRVNNDFGKFELMKPYFRNTNNPILFDGDKFALDIDKNGFIMKFHQI